MGPNIISDQGLIWTSPARIRKDHYWIPVTVVLGATAALIALDPVESHYFRNTSTYSGFNKIFSSNNAAVATIVAPLSLYGAGLVRRDSKMQSTALLAGEAVADSEILRLVLTDIDRRIRPVAIQRQGNFSDSWFEEKGFRLAGAGSFPSGHTIAAFSIATVVAREYGKRHHWVTYVAYGAAALIGFSRMSLSSHYLSDAFVGGVLGYSVSRFAVLRQ